MVIKRIKKHILHSITYRIINYDKLMKHFSETLKLQILQCFDFDIIVIDKIENINLKVDYLCMYLMNCK